MITVKDLMNVANGFTAMVYCDTASDLTDVPEVVSDYRLTLGTHVYVAETSTVYNLQSDGNLVEA